MIKISPHVPSSLLGLRPAPQRPRLLGRLIHVGQVATVIEFCEPRVVAEVAFAEIVSHLVAGDVAAPHWKGHREDSSCPAVVVASVSDSEGSVLYGYGVVWAGGSQVVTDTENGQGFGAGLIAFEGVAVVAGKAAGPVVFVGRKYGGLEGEPLVERLERVGNGGHQRRRSRLCGGHGHEQQQSGCQLQALHLQIQLDGKKLLRINNSSQLPLTPRPQNTHTATPSPSASSTLPSTRSPPRFLPFVFLHRRPSASLNLFLSCSRPIFVSFLLEICWLSVTSGHSQRNSILFRTFCP